MALVIGVALTGLALQMRRGVADSIPAVAAAMTPAAGSEALATPTSLAMLVALGALLLGAIGLALRRRQA
jgi:hypothetical protein